jgi:protein-disulfide isomerase
MHNDMSRAESSGPAKKIITVVVVVLLALSFGYYLFKISPQQTTSSDYNNSITPPSSSQTLTEPPAFDPNFDHFMGNVNAKNVFIEYGDMQCPACAAYDSVLKQVPSQFTDTVFVFRHFPLVQIHKNAVESAMALEAAGAQGKYWEMREALFQKQRDWEGLSAPLDAFAQYAQEVGVANIDQFKSDVTSKKYLSAIQRNTDEAYALGLQGTPSIFFNGHPLKTGADINGLKKEAEQYLVK